MSTTCMFFLRQLIAKDMDHVDLVCKCLCLQRLQARVDMDLMDQDVDHVDLVDIDVSPSSWKCWHVRQL